MLVDWRTLKKGDVLDYFVDDFDGFSISKCIVTDITRDYAVVFNTDLEVTMYVDDDNVDVFKLVRKNGYSRD